jgi:hypothetical protein
MNKEGHKGKQNKKENDRIDRESSPEPKQHQDANEQRNLKENKE